MGLSVRILVSVLLTVAQAAQAVVYPVQYAQLSSPGPFATSSQEHEPAFSTLDTFVGDDFVVPAGEFGWDLRQIYVRGAYSTGAGPMPAVNVAFHLDAGGKPGAEVAGCRYDGIVPSADLAGDLTIPLSPPCILGIRADSDTRYWVVVQARMDSEPGGRFWYWRNHGAAGLPAVLRAPGGGIEACVDWGARAADCGLDPVSPDQCFAVYGYDGIFSNGFEIGDTSPWSDSVGE
jgi:hypothetical protein